MAKQRPSLEAFAQSAASPPPAAAPAGNVVELAAPATPASPAKSDRKDRPHVSLYLSKKAQKTIKTIALEYDCKPHDLYLQGIDMMLAPLRPPEAVATLGRYDAVAQWCLLLRRGR